MIYQDKDNFYFKLPRTFGVLIGKAVVQACLSMKQDNNSPENSLDSSQIILLQLANFIYNAKPLTDEQSSIAKKAFDAEENKEDESQINE